MINNIPPSTRPTGSTVARSILDHVPLEFKTRSGNNAPVNNMSTLFDHANDVKFVCLKENMLDESDSASSHKAWPFYLQHETLFKEAQEVFLQLFGEEPDVLLLYTYKTNLKLSSFLFSRREYIDKVMKNQCVLFDYKSEKIPRVEREIIQENRSNRPIKTIQYQSSSYHFELPEGIYPVIGFFNDVTSTVRQPCYSLLFGSNFNKSFETIERELGQKKERDIPVGIKLVDKSEDECDCVSYLDPKLPFHDGLPMFCVSNYKLTTKNSLKRYDPQDLSRYYKPLREECARDFFSTICEVLFSYSRASYLNTNNDQFAASMPHFYNKERVIESVKEDDDRKTFQRSLYRKTEDYMHNHQGNLTFKDFIKFFVQSSYINLDNFLSHPYSEMEKAFKEKRTLKQLIGKKEFLTRFLNNRTPNNNFRNFLDGQERAQDGLKREGIL